MSKRKQYTQEFKEEVVRYILEHPEIPITESARKFGIADSTIHTWRNSYLENHESVPTRGSGNYSSDEAKEIARLKKELKDTNDALEILKKAIGILGN